MFITTIQILDLSNDNCPIDAYCMCSICANKRLVNSNILHSKYRQTSENFDMKAG